jgi:hypothetical protein
MLWLMEEALPGHPVILDFPATADLAGSFEWADDRQGQNLCHALARAFVATLCGLRGGEIPP